jgi:hypothetical protein
VHARRALLDRLFALLEARQGQFVIQKLGAGRRRQGQHVRVPAFELLQAAAGAELRLKGPDVALRRDDARSSLASSARSEATLSESM